MTNTQVISNLWQEFREAINKAYAATKNDAYDATSGLRDYAEDTGWVDDLQTLLDTEMANERQHRKGRPMVAGFGAGAAARLILMQTASRQALKGELPASTDYLIIRHTAFEAELIGYLVREQLHKDWHKAIESFDYAKLMAA